MRRQHFGIVPAQALARGRGKAASAASYAVARKESQQPISESELLTPLASDCPTVDH
jgi:hypothetical protein